MEIHVLTIKVINQLAQDLVVFKESFLEFAKKSKNLLF